MTAPRLRARRLLALLLGLLWVGPAFAEGGRPAILDQAGLEQKLDEQVPLGLHFRDESGSDVELGRYFRDKPVILSLVYYECPMLCTLVLNGLVSSLRTMSLDVGRDFDVVTVSFDARETPELAAKKKQTYLEQYRRPGAADGWHFLTGDQASIDALAQSVGFQFAFDEKSQQFAHAAGIIVLTPQGRVSRYFYGVEYAPRDLRLGLVEASQNKIGSLVDQILLFCFHYDPLTGRYSALSLNIVRAGGALTVLALVAFIALMLRRDRRAGVFVPASPQPPTPSPHS
jgi:protein SCO1